MNPIDLEEWIKDDLFAVTNALDNAGLFDTVLVARIASISTSRSGLPIRANDFLFTTRCTALSLQQ